MSCLQSMSINYDFDSPLNPWSVMEVSGWLAEAAKVSSDILQEKTYYITSDSLLFVIYV